MKKYLTGSISGLKLKSYGILGVKFFKLLKDCPVSIAHEIIYKNGKDIPWGLHSKTTEFIYVVNGKARADLGSKSFNVRAGNYLMIPPGIKHRFVTGKQDLVAISVFSPPMNPGNLDAVLCADTEAKKTTRGKTARAE